MTPHESGLFTRPNQKLNSETFFHETAAYDRPNMAVVWYVYRLWPAIDRKLGALGPGAPSYIAKSVEPINAEWLLKQWGSGDYKVCFTDAGQPRGRTQVAQTIVQVRDEAFPPVLDQAELVLGDPANRSYVDGLRQRGLFKDENEESVSRSEVSAVVDLAKQYMGPAAAGANVPKQALDLLTAATERSMAMQQGVFTTMLQATAAGAGSQNDMVLKLLMEQNQTLMKLMLDRPTPQTQSQGLEEMVKNALNVRALLQELVPAEPRESGTNWASLLSAFLPVAQQLVAARASGASAPVLTPLQQAVPIGEAGRPLAPVVPIRHDVPVVAEQLDLAQLPTKVAGDVARYLERGISGEVYAAHVCMHEGDEAYSQVRSLGVDALVHVLLSDPVAANILGPHRDELQLFVSEFVAFGDEADEETFDGGALPKVAAA